MPSKAKCIAISGFCGALATLCLIACSLPATKWFVVILAVVASVSVAIPTMVSGKTIYSVLTYLASAIIGLLVGVSNIGYVAPVVFFAMPVAVVKVHAESLKVATKVEKRTIDDPFDNGDDKQVMAVQIDAQPRMKVAVKWILYYVLLEVAIGLTLLASYLFVPLTFQWFMQNNLFLWLAIAFQLVPIPYNLLLIGSFNFVAKILKKHILK